MKLYREKNVIVATTCAHDDSSICADAQWNNEICMRKFNTTEVPMVPKKSGPEKGQLHPRPDDVGKLPENVPQSKFASDPNHRRKGLHGKLLAFYKLKKKNRKTVTKMDCTRIAKNYGCFAGSSPAIPEEMRCQKVQDVAEHHFDNHEHCGAWCKRKNESEEERVLSAKYYRSKVADKEPHEEILDVTAPHFEKERLKDISHGMDANMNEAFNCVCTWFAPKNKLFSGSESPQNRISFAIGVNSVGISVYFTRLF